MPRFHISAAGEPALCKATKQSCPLGADAPHAEFESIEAARGWSETILANAHTAGLAGATKEKTGKRYNYPGLSTKSIATSFEDLAEFIKGETGESGAINHLAASAEALENFDSFSEDDKAAWVESSYQAAQQQFSSMSEDEREAIGDYLDYVDLIRGDEIPGSSVEAKLDAPDTEKAAGNPKRYSYELPEFLSIANSFDTVYDFVEAESSENNKLAEVAKTVGKFRELTQEQRSEWVDATYAAAEEQYESLSEDLREPLGDYLDYIDIIRRVI